MNSAIRIRPQGEVSAQGTRLRPALSADAGPDTAVRFVACCTASSAAAGSADEKNGPTS